MKARQSDIGKQVTFKACTRSHFRKATRIIKSVLSNGSPVVGYVGWPNFIVRPKEVIEIHR